MLVLEQLLDQIERLAARRRQEVAAHGGARQQTSRSRCGSGSAKRSGIRTCAVIASALRFQSRKVCRVARREARDVGDGLLEIAPEHKRGAVAMGLPEFIARRDVGDLVGEVEVLNQGVSLMWK